MKEYTVSSIAALETVLSDAGPDVLYRGQTKHYGEPQTPSVTTSFDRLGCIPSEMGKWIYYASNVLEEWLGLRVRSLEFSQAVLQHYGWRSFFIDVTSKPAVATWFASCVYKDAYGIDMCEDAHETGVWLRKKRASYEFQDGTGHLYLIRKPAPDADVGAVDLSAIHIEGARPRSSAQAAWLIGPLANKPLPPSYYVAKITADRSLLRDFAAKHSFDAVESLFPTRREDPILNSLLCLPWIEMTGLDKKGGSSLSIPAFRRTIEFPEYDGDFHKFLPAHIALYRHSSVTQFESLDGAPGGIGFKVPENTIFGVANPPATRFPRVLKLLEANECVTFEVDQLIRYVRLERSSLYGKGVSVVRRGERLMEVCALMVDHPGMVMERAGLNQGWFYEIGSDGSWTRRRHEDECPCGNDYVHERHLSALTIIEYWLGTPDGLRAISQGLTSPDAACAMAR